MADEAQRCWRLARIVTDTKNRFLQIHSISHPFEDQIEWKRRLDELQNKWKQKPSFDNKRERERESEKARAYGRI